MIYLSVASHLLLFTRAGVIMCCAALAVVAGRVLLSAENRKAIDLALTAFLGSERASKLINTVSGGSDIILQCMRVCPFKKLLYSQNVNDSIKRYNSSEHLLASSTIAKLRCQIGAARSLLARQTGALQHSTGTLTGPLVPRFVFVFLVIVVIERFASCCWFVCLCVVGCVIAAFRGRMGLSSCQTGLLLKIK